MRVVENRSKRDSETNLMHRNIQAPKEFKQKMI